VLPGAKSGGKEFGPVRKGYTLTEEKVSCPANENKKATGKGGKKRMAGKREKELSKLEKKKKTNGKMRARRKRESEIVQTKKTGGD